MGKTLNPVSPFLSYNTFCVHASENSQTKGDFSLNLLTFCLNDSKNLRSDKVHRIKQVSDSCLQRGFYFHFIYSYLQVMMQAVSGFMKPYLRFCSLKIHAILCDLAKTATSKQKFRLNTWTVTLKDFGGKQKLV